MLPKVAVWPPFSHGLEYDELLSVLNVLFNRAVAPAVAHVSLLTFTEVVKYSVIVEAIRIQVWNSRFAGEGDDDLVILWG